MRGIGATLVVLEHLAYIYLPDLRWTLFGHLSLGTCGVLVFFLVSGYIVPASLERTGNVRDFWISRLCRLYPLWAVAVTLAVALAAVGLQPHTAEVLQNGDPVATTVAHIAMLQTLLASPSAIYVMWSLAFEMAFYLLVAALFSIGWHRWSAQIALVLALAAVTLGGLLPPNALSNTVGVLPVAVLGTGLAVLAIAGSLSARRRIVLAAALLGGLLAVVLVGANSTSRPWEGLAMFAMMFLGTAIYRAEHAQIRWRTAVPVAVAVVACAVLAGVWHVTTDGHLATRVPYQRSWAVTVVLAAVVFAAGMALRHRRLPAPLVRLGVLSYSIYLLHPVLLQVCEEVFGRSAHNNWIMTAGFLGVLVALSWFTQRFVEAPGQRLGRRLRKRWALPAS